MQTSRPFLNLTADGTTMQSQDPLDLFGSAQWNTDNEESLFASVGMATPFMGSTAVPGTDNSNGQEQNEAGELRETKYTYKDHMNDPDGDYMATSDVAQQATGGNASSGVDQSFPVRLHYMLQEIEKDGLSHIVSWQPHGRCFVVHDQKAFVDSVLGNWFRMSKYPSFQRQLNIYGFQRLTTGPDKGGYYNELFLRSKPGLAYKIRRHKLKGTGTRKAAVPELEPNFYRMPFLPPTKPRFTQGAGGDFTFHPTEKRGFNSGFLMAGPQGLSSNACTSTSNGGMTLRSIAPALFAPTSGGGAAPTNNGFIYGTATGNNQTTERGVSRPMMAPAPLRHPLLMGSMPAASSPSQSGRRGMLPATEQHNPFVSAMSSNANGNAVGGNSMFSTSITDYHDLANTLWRMH